MRPDAETASPSSEVLEHLGFIRSDDLLIVCHDEHEPSELDWTAWLRRLAAVDYASLLISTRGGGPSPKQRARLALLWHDAGRLPPPIALLTDAERPRACIESLAWFVRLDVSVHPASDLSAALARLGCSAPPGRVAALLARLHSAIDRRCPEHQVPARERRPRGGRRGREA